MDLNALLPIYKLEITVFIYHCLWVTINPTSPTKRLQLAIYR